MSLPSESETMLSLSAQGRVPMATIENVAEELRRVLNSIQAIAYYVEMTLPFCELPSLEYLRKVQELVDECHDILHSLVQGCTATVQGCTATENLVSETNETNSDYDECRMS